ncbi:MAG: PucR family transcriptional regulator [Desulfitobacterium sp.]
MSSKEKIKVALTNSVLEMNNLEQVLSFLRRSTGRDIVISDYKGTVYAHSEPNREDLGSEYFDLILDWNNENPYLYDKGTKTLCFKVGSNENDGFIFVKEIAEQDCQWIIEFLEQASLALRTYFNHTYSIEKLENSYTHNFLTDVLLRNINIKDIIKQNYPLLNYDLNSLYYVSIFSPHKNLSELEKQALLTYSQDWLKRNSLDIYCTYWDNNKYLVFICPTHYDRKTLAIDFSWKKHVKNNSQYYEDVRLKFKFEASMSMGDKYVIDQLHHSYQEALFALYLAEFIGKGNQVNHICNLGIFTLIFQKNNVTELKSLCGKYLNSLIANDKEHNSMFLNTLRCYFDTNLNANETAEQLYLHINTLRYRLKRIEELTDTSLQKIYDRTNLYVALKVYDVLGSLELVVHD